jgi:hypothetical protein
MSNREIVDPAAYTYEALEAHIRGTYEKGSDVHTEALIYLDNLKAKGVTEGADLYAAWFGL